MRAGITITVVLPLYTQPNKAERRRQAQEPGNPTIDRRHNSKPMHIQQYPRMFFAESPKVSGAALRDLCWKHTNSLKVPQAWKTKNFSKNLTSELGQVFGANPKIGLKKFVLLSCINMTHPISRPQAGQPTAVTSYPEGGVLLVRPVQRTKLERL